MDKESLKGSLRVFNILDCLRYKAEFKRNHPEFFDPSGTLIFCGGQGNGKTISAVKYVLGLKRKYPKAIVVTNVAITELPFNCDFAMVEGKPVMAWRDRYDGEGNPLTFTQEDIDKGEVSDLVFEYSGLDCLSYISNRDKGVIYFIDEFHLEMNSLESGNISIETMTEISQQRKQRKHIVATSQIYMRLAKPLREQIKNVVLCRCWFGMMQFNKLIDGEESTEKNGKLEAKVRRRFLWFHSPKDWKLYDTFAKMKRYQAEWKGRKIDSALLYETPISVRSVKK